jgi:hypothetical protein
MLKIQEPWHIDSSVVHSIRVIDTIARFQKVGTSWPSVLQHSSYTLPIANKTWKLLDLEIQAESTTLGDRQPHTKAYDLSPWPSRTVRPSITPKTSKCSRRSNVWKEALFQNFPVLTKHETLMFSLKTSPTRVCTRVKSTGSLHVRTLEPQFV